MVGLALCCLLVSVVTDLGVREIPDGISLTFVGMAFFRLTQGIMLPVSGTAVIFAVLLGLWKLGLMGGGDVKLISSTSLVIPLRYQFEYVLDIALCGGCLAMVYALCRGWFPIPKKGVGCRLARLECRRLRRGGPLPYAIAIASGFVLTILNGGGW